MWHIERGGRERTPELRLSYRNCFPYKSFSLTNSPHSLLECSIFKKWLLFHVSSPQYTNRRDKYWKTNRKWRTWLVDTQSGIFTLSFANLQSRSPPPPSLIYSHWTRQWFISVQVKIHVADGTCHFYKILIPLFYLFVLRFGNFIHESHHRHPPGKRRSCSPPLVERWRWRCLCLQRRSD